jgi:hypothetical protein
LNGTRRATDALWTRLYQFNPLQQNTLQHNTNPEQHQTTVMSDNRMEVDDVDQVGSPAGPPPPLEDKPSDQPKGKTSIKPTAALTRESGKSLLPISRVQNIMKADKVRPRSRFTCVVVFDTTSGVTHCRKGGRISHIISSGRIHQKIIRS